MITTSKINGNMFEMLEKKERRERKRVLAWMSIMLLTVSENLQTNYLWNGVWIIGPLGYPSKDV